MKKNELKLGVKVVDCWYPDWGTATVIKVLKTRVHLEFQGFTRMVYDTSHFQFLEPAVASSQGRTRSLTSR